MKRDVVPVSILYSTTGPYAALGRDALDGAMAAVAEVNADAHYPFRIAPQVDDPAGRAERYATLADAALRRSGCRHVIGTITSWSRKDVLPVVERHGGLLWYAFPYEGFEASDSIVYLGACPNQHLLPLFDTVLPRYGKRPFIVGSNYIWGWEVSRIAREAAEAAGGDGIVERFVPLGSTEVDHLIAEIRQKKPDFILSNLVGQSASAFIDAYDGLRTADAAFRADVRPLVACNLSETDLDGLSAQAKAGHITASTYFQALDTAENRAFKDRMAARHGTDRRLTMPFVSAYLAVSLLAQSMRDAASDEPEAIRRIVTARQFETPIGPIAVDPRTQHAALRPHLGVSNEAGDFRVFSSAPAPIAADPFLLGRERMPQPIGNDDHPRSLSASPLMVVK